MRKRGILRTLLCILLGCSVAPSLSHAATASVTNGTLIYRASPGVTNTLEISGPFCFSPIPGPCPPDDIRFRLLDFGQPFGRPGGETITPLAGCVAGSPQWGGREAYCSASATAIDVDLADGDDWIDATGVLVPATIRAGPGDDQLRDGAGNDTVIAGSGDDTFYAKPGNDVLRGEAGADTYYALFCELVCAPLRDTQRETGSDTFLGGSDRDTADFSDVFASERLSADGVRNDGKPNEGDNIGGDVEDILAGPLTDTVVGNAGDNQLDAGNGNDTVHGGPGTDALQGDSGEDTLDGGPGADALRGGPGRDTASYADRSARVVLTFDGAPNDGEPNEGDRIERDVENGIGGSGSDDLIGSSAANHLEGGSGEDYLDGASGADSLVGGAAFDLLRLRDRAVDPTAACGSGSDFVIADPQDAAARDCEEVDDVLTDQPVLGRRVTVEPAAGAMRMQLPVAHRFVPLVDHVNIPIRSSFDASAGRLKLTSRAVIARRRRPRQRGVFSRGLFQVLQARSGRQRGITELRLKGGSFAGCQRARTGVDASAVRRRGSRRVIRRLRANAKGRFRTRGRYSAATVRGTEWEVADRCDGTLTRVTRGRVAVRDFRLKRTVHVRAGKHYLAASK